MIDIQFALPILINLSLEAGAGILRYYSADTACEIKVKEDDSPLTEADLAANTIIVNGLRKNFPGIPIISEEEKIQTATNTISNFFLIDPLDGTKEFIARNGEFTVNIALIQNGQPRIGVIFAPALDTLYYASSGHGAFRVISKGQPRKIVSCLPRKPPRLVLSRSHTSKEELTYIQKNGIKEVIPMGSSLKGCLVAQGDADIYLRTGNVMQWDIAAMHCILIEANCSIVFLDDFLHYTFAKRVISGFIISN